MVRVINHNKWNELKRELQDKFPTLDLNDLNQVDKSMDSLIKEISRMSGIDHNETSKLVRQALEYINSKHVL